MRQVVPEIEILAIMKNKRNNTARKIVSDMMVPPLIFPCSHGDILSDCQCTARCWNVKTIMSHKSIIE